jgi:OmpA-OmpF porin, OOP family
MIKPVKLAYVVAAAAIATSASTVLAQEAKNDGYVTSPNGQVVKDPFGLCWKTPWFTPAKAVAGCDDDLLPKAPPPPPPAPPKPVEAPKAVGTPPAAPPKPAAPRPPAGPTIEKVTFAADAFFDVNKSVLKPEGKAKLDDLVTKLGGITLEVIIAVGHTDSDGSDAANQKLSVRRSEAVKAYMVSKGIEANRVYTEGKGEKQPVADNKTKEGKAKNRRVEIEVVGTRPIKK